MTERDEGEQRCPYDTGMTVRECHRTDICDCFDYPEVPRGA